MADLANNSMSRGRPWHALQQQAFSMAQSEDATNRESAYRVFAGSPNLIIDLQPQTVLAILEKGLQDPHSVEVRSFPQSSGFSALALLYLGNGEALLYFPHKVSVRRHAVLLLCSVALLSSCTGLKVLLDDDLIPSRCRTLLGDDPLWSPDCLCTIYVHATYFYYYCSGHRHCSVQDSIGIPHRLALP